MTSRFGLRPQFAVVGGLSALTLFALSAFPAGAKGPGNDPAALITRMENLYLNAKSYQGTISMRQSGKTADGKTFAITESRQVRFKAPNQIFDEQRYAGTGGAANAVNKSVLWVGDGKSLYVYIPAQKQYAKRPAPPRITLAQILKSYLLNKPQFTLSMGSGAKINGREALVVLAKPKIPTQFPANVPAQDQPKIIERIKRQRPTQIFIDKRNYQLLRVAGGSEERSDEINFVSQLVNGAVADSVFTFRIPAGAKLYVAPPGGTPNPGMAPHR